MVRGDRVRILHGVSSPDEVVAAVEAGVDVFDSSFAFDMTETGCALCFPFESAVVPDAAASDRPPAVSICLWDFEHREDFRPLLEGCACYTCTNHSRAYIHHLLNVHEMLASVLLMM